MTLSLQPAHPLEAGRIGAILSAHVDETPWLPRVLSRAEELQGIAQMIEAGWVTTARVDARLAGFLARGGSEIHGLYVAAGWRRRGIGATLLHHAQQRVSHLGLWSYVANDPANRLYIQSGFREVARSDGDANDAGLPDIRFEWQRECA